MVLDVESLPSFGRIFIYGVLEFEWEHNLDLTLSATHIFISGGRLIVGWEVRRGGREGGGEEEGFSGGWKKSKIGDQLDLSCLSVCLYICI